MNERGKTSSDSKVAKHSAFNPGHTFNLDCPKILCFEHNVMKGRIKGALFIQKLKPTLNIKEKSYKLFLFKNSGKIAKKIGQI